MKASTDETDDKDKCFACGEEEGDTRAFRWCLNKGPPFCSGCADKLGAERIWCGLCTWCHHGKIKVKLVMQGHKPRKNKSKLTTCGRGCQGDWDVRVRCEINCPAKNSVDQFLACPSRVSSMAFWIANEYELYKLAEEGDFTYLDQFAFTDEDKLEIIAKYHDR